MLTGQDGQLIELLKFILQASADRRPDAAQILQTPFFFTKWCWPGCVCTYIRFLSVSRGIKYWSKIVSANCNELCIKMVWIGANIGAGAQRKITTQPITISLFPLMAAVSELPLLTIKMLKKMENSRVKRRSYLVRWPEWSVLRANRWFYRWSVPPNLLFSCSFPINMQYLWHFIDSASLHRCIFVFDTLSWEELCFINKSEICLLGTTSICISLGWANVTEELFGKFRKRKAR